MFFLGAVLRRPVVGVGPLRPEGRRGEGRAVRRRRTEPRHCVTRDCHGGTCSLCSPAIRCTASVPYRFLQGAPTMSQRTLVLLKPDAVRRGLIGEIIGRIETKAGWTITALELRTLDRDTLEQHYARARGQAVLRAAGGVHGLRSGRRAGRRGRAGHRGRARAGRARPTRSPPPPAPSGATSARSSGRT